MDTKKLRQKILDLAIRGKLVPQDPNDEPAIELMRRINPRFESYCEEKCQIEIPNNWIVCHLGDLYNIVSAKRVHKSEWKHSGIPFYRAREIAKLATEGYVNNELYISETHYEEMKLNYGVPNPTDIMMSAVGTIGKTYIVKEKDVFYYKDASVLCLKNINNLYSPYISLLLSSEFLQNQMFEKSKGTTVDTITIEKAKSYRILLPPLSEQKRIVSAIEQWFSLIDILENENSALQASIQQAKSKILDLAIHGKLVPQDPNDEPAIELLKHINPRFEPCDEEDCPHEVPEGWTFCYLQNVFKITMGSSPVGESFNRIGEGIEFHQGKMCFTELYLGISDVYSTEPIKIANPDSLLLCVRAPVGIVNICNREICIGRGLCALTPLQGLDLKYGFYALQTCQQDFEQKATGSTFKAISGDVVKNRLSLFLRIKSNSASSQR